MKATIVTDGKSVIKYESRAPPRRRNRGDDYDEQPVFLRKAYQMMSTCPSDVGGWSETGETIVIKDVKQFSERIIPTAYKHNNFSSFVRQLNFYGFRKIKSSSATESSWWEFRHPCFIRGKPHLLSEIKRSVHFAESNGSSQEVSALKSEVTSLNEKISEMHDQISFLMEAVEKLKVKSSCDGEDSSGTVKKRKRTASVANEKGQGSRAPMLPNIPTCDDLGDFTWSENVGLDDNGDAFLDQLIELEEMNNPSPNLSMKIEDELPIPMATESNPSAPSSMADLTVLLERLAPEQKDRFVDKLAEVIGAHLANNMHTPVAIASPEHGPNLKNESLPLQTCNFTHGPTFVLPSGAEAPTIALPLASAAISACLLSNFPTLYNAAVAPTFSGGKEMSI